MVEIDVNELKVPAKAKIRIAIADDHAIFRDGLCRLLSLQDDFDVVAQVEDGLHVSEMLQQFDPDILLLDLNMPVLSGLEALQRIQAAKYRTRVILLTASDNQQEFVQALKLGTWGIVQKQTATELLIDSIRRVHDGELWMDSRTTAAVIQWFVSPSEAPRPGKCCAKPGAEHFTIEPARLGEPTMKNHLHNYS